MDFMLKFFRGLTLINLILLFVFVPLLKMSFPEADYSHGILSDFNMAVDIVVNMLIFVGCMFFLNRRAVK